MATLVCFHAHPDDECIQTGGIMRIAHEAGHRVVLVVATRGEHGEVAEGFLDEGEELWERRVKETAASAEVLGVDRVVYLGYVDSGMIDTPQNHAPESFWQADLEEAAARLAQILQEEEAEVLTVYDDHGGYGHPDHIQVHRVGYRAAEMAGTPRVYETTVNRDQVQRLFDQMSGAATPDPDAPHIPEGTEMPDLDTSTFGSPEALITARVDVSAFLDFKRRAMRAHASQISDTSFFLTLPPDAFAAAFGVEWFIRRGQGPGITETSLLS